MRDAIRRYAELLLTVCEDEGPLVMAYDAVVTVRSRMELFRVSRGELLDPHEDITPGLEVIVLLAHAAVVRELVPNLRFRKRSPR